MRVSEVVDQGVLVPYGDYDANTHPIDVIAVDAEGSVTTLLADLPTEALHRFRRLNDGEVWAPSVDPAGSAPGFVVTSQGGWHTITVEVDGLPALEHGFDVAQEPNDDRFVCGSRATNTAMVWRSADGGTTWTEVLAQVATDARFNNFYRVDGALAVANNLGFGYVVLIDGTWTVVPDAVPDDERVVWIDSSVRVVHHSRGVVRDLPGSASAWTAAEAPDGSIYVCDGDAIYLIPPPD